MPLLKHKQVESCRRLSSWIDSNGIAGYDPYDLKSMPWILELIKLGNKYFIFEIIREFIFEMFLYFPVVFRKLFRIRKKENAKAVGLLASSNIDLYSDSGDKKYLDKATSYLKWLDKKAVKSYIGIGWGYPFDWQSKALIPKYTPNGIVTTAVADAYWKMYKLENNQSYLDKCVLIGEFLFSLPTDRVSDSKLCFSYTPLFINHVHNLNLFVAEFLLKVGLQTGREEWIETALKAICYTLADQHPDGGFDYNGPPEKPLNKVDHYHTGFNMRMLYSIWKLTGNQKVKTSLDKCYDHYLNNFFDGPKPKFTPNRLYRIDSHSVSECVHCLYTLAPDYPEGVIYADRTLDWAIDNLQDKE
ncbi:MAG: hypothetical protein ACI959_001972, partial [Limisphaerales bacterium]